MNEDMREVINEFLVESNEGLDRLDRDLVELEVDPTSRDALGSIFRTMHTIKGTCGFLGFGRLETLAHAAENLLALLRDGKLTINRPIIDALLASVDAVRIILAGVETTGEEPAEDYAELCHLLHELQTPGAVSEAVAPPVAAIEPIVADAPAPVETVEQVVVPEAEAVTHSPEVVEAPAPAPAAVDDLPMDKPKKKRTRRALGEILKEKGFVDDSDLMLATTEQSFGDSRRIGQILGSLGIVTEDQLLIALREQQVLDEDRQQQQSDQTVRVDVHLLDSLMNLIGELVLARNQLVQLASDRHDAEYLVPAQRLNIITSELQAGVMKTRMQPIGSVWQRLPRVVRDLTVALGKQVRIEVDGAETELDRTILEAIKDPLTHIVRNSVDHGFEMPAARVEAGKNAEGVLRLRAFHESGKMNIEISDDGGGIDPAKIRAKAISSGIMTAEQANRTGDREILSCIFSPGFSTAAAVTNISGRGVGMDVVKTNMEGIGGTVEIQSELGRGTTIRIKIPLTLAIIPALVVMSGGQRYVIPQVSLVELVRLDTGEMTSRIELIHGVPVYRLRGRLLPIVDLSDVLSGGSGIDIERSLSTSRARSVNVVVLQADGQAFGLIVDGVFDTQEIVVKPLGKQLRDLNVFAGATIMGDGKLSLIIDVGGLARQTGVMKEQGERPITSRGTHTIDGSTSSSTTLVVVQVGAEQIAVPLNKIARLERFQPEVMERSQGRAVVQYRGEILPLLSLAAAIGEYSTPPEEGPVPVLVHTVHDRSVGVLVDAILDITDSDVDKRDGYGLVIGTSVINQRVTSVIDTTALVHNEFPPSELDPDGELFDMAVPA
jgi:two-component system, chemotaxis family, sensor kinase CheA